MTPIGLGRGDFHALNSTLSLTLNASAEVQLDSDTIDIKETELLQLLQSGEIWLAPAPEIKLRICIGVQSDLAHHASTFVSQAGELLRSSKIWSDMGLAVLFKSCDHVYDSDESSSVQLLFGLHRMAGQSKSSKLRLPSTLQGFHEAVPPVGITTARLSSVTVSLEYKPEQEINQYTQMQPYTTPSSSSYENSQYDSIVGSPLPFTQYFPPGQTVTATTGKDIAVLFMRELQDSNEDWTIPLHDTIQRNGDNRYTQEFNELLDIGLRSLIAREPTGVSSSIIKDMSLHLSELAPTVFSLGYSEAMNQRSQFIPLIAKSMASIMQRKSPIRQKRAESKSSPTEERKSNLRTQIKQSLWRIAQKQLFNPKASRNLTPLHAGAAFVPEDELLDYITEGDGGGGCSDTLISDEEEDYYLGTDEEEIDAQSWKQYPFTYSENDLDSSFSTTTNSDKDLLDFDSDIGDNQDSMSTICEHEIPLPSPSTNTPSSCPQTSMWTSSSRRLLQGISSESEMLTDIEPVDEKISPLGSAPLDDGGLASMLPTT